MRTIVSGTVNGVAFSLKEDGKTVCKESKYCSLISESAKKSLDKTQEEIKQGLHPTVVFNIVEDLEDRKDVKIRVDKTIEYFGEITEVHYLHMLKNKDNSKMLFLKGRFDYDGIFKVEVSVDLSTKVINPDGKLEPEIATQIKTMLQLMRMDYSSPSIPDKNYAVYQEIKKTLPNFIIEQACFYHYPINPNVVY